MPPDPYGFNEAPAHMIRLFACLLALVSATAAHALEAARVYAAASLAESIAAAADAYAADRHPHPVVVLASSSELARQIEAGAPGGVFVSADQRWMDHIASRGFLNAGTRTNLLTNTLVVIVGDGDARRITIAPGFDFAKFVGDGRWTTGDPDSVPIGRYAKAALIKLGAWEAAAPKLAPAADTRAALAFVEGGEAKVGIVYGTDAKASNKVSVAGVFPENSHEPIVYPEALVGSAGQEARHFAEFLRGSAARAIFVHAGFGVPKSR